MAHILASAADYLSSFWKSESCKSKSIFIERSVPFELTVAQSATRALNQGISDRLPGCSLCKATLRETKKGELSFHTESGKITIFPDERIMGEYLAEKSGVDSWEIQDLRREKSRVFYILQRTNAWGCDTFETKEKFFDQLREELGVFWKLEDPESRQATYIRYKTGLFGSSYEHVAHENLIYVASSLGFGAPNRATSTSDRASWGVGKSIVACLLGGLLISAGRSWESNQNSVSDALAMAKGTLGPAAFKTAFVFQTSMIAAMSKQEGRAFLGALLAAMMLPKPGQGQSLCPRLAGRYETVFSHDVVISNKTAYVADDGSGFRIINITDPLRPTQIGRYDAPGAASGVAVSGNYAYIADWTFGILAINMSDPTNLTLAGSYDTPGLASHVVTSGRYAYLANGNPGLLVFDISDPANLRLIGSYDTPGWAYDVAVSGDYAFVADREEGLRVLNISDPTNITFTASIAIPGSKVNIVLSDDFAYLADAIFGLQIVNVTIPSDPIRTGIYNATEVRAWGVAVSGKTAYVMDRPNGLLIINVTNSSNPTLVGFYNLTSSGDVGVAVLENFAYVAHGPLSIIALDCPTSTSSTTTFTTSSSTTTSIISSLAPTVKRTTTIFSLSTGSTTTKTPIFPSVTGASSSDTSSFLWIIGLAVGGVLCFGLTGGAVCIVRRRQKASSQQANVPELGFNLGTHSVDPSEGEYQKASDIYNPEDHYAKTPNYVIKQKDEYQKASDIYNPEDHYAKTPNYVINQSDYQKTPNLGLGLSPIN